MSFYRFRNISQLVIYFMYLRISATYLQNIQYPLLELKLIFNGHDICAIIFGKFQVSTLAQNILLKHASKVRYYLTIFD